MFWKSKLNPFGNYDQPEPPEVYVQKYGKFFAYIYWFFIRNPFHNFSIYWIGTGSFPSIWKVWHDQRKWNLILPFFSYRGKWILFYIGWRPRSDGSQGFGIAIKKAPRG